MPIYTKTSKWILRKKNATETRDNEYCITQTQILLSALFGTAYDIQTFSNEF